MNNDTSEIVRIPLSKKSKKNAGKYETIVDSIDSDLAEVNWSIMRITNHTMYAGSGTQKTKKAAQLHRVILARKLGRTELLPSEHVDHINGDGLDNRRENLRLVTHAQNMQNYPKPLNNTSGYKGVCWHKGQSKWVAQINVSGKKKHLGTFNTKEDAYKAYCKAAKMYFGEYANLGDKD